MLTRTLEGGRQVVTLGPSGVVRFFPAAFLAFWLCGWVLGEAFALGAIAWALGALLGDAVRLPPSTPPPAGAALMLVFLVVWVSLWTLGGIGAAKELLRLVWGSDRLVFDSATLVREVRRGPFTRRRVWARGELRDVRLDRRGQALVTETTAGNVLELTRYGSPDERTTLRDELRATLALAPPAAAIASGLPDGWESVLGSDGSERLRRATRAAQARFCWVVAAAAAALVLAARPPVGIGTAQAIVAAIGLAVATLGVWLRFGTSDVGVRAGEVEFRRTFGERVWRDLYRPTALRVTRRVDSDDDEHFAVVVEDGARTRTILSTLNDPTGPLRIGRWLAARLGRPLDVDPGVLPDEARRANG